MMKSTLISLWSLALLVLGALLIQACQNPASTQPPLSVQDRPVAPASRLAQAIKDSGEKILIAHAGGGIREWTYTNSLEALDNAVANGYTYIELDFMELESGEIVLLHDWRPSYRKYFEKALGLTYDGIVKPEDRIKSAAEFKSQRMTNGLTPIDINDLMAWMADHPDVLIITDVKTMVYGGERRFLNVQGLKKIREKAGPYLSRFIAQIYDPTEYDAVRRLGFENIILTTYMLDHPLDVEALGDFCRERELFGLTMPDGWFADDTYARLGEINTPVFLHTTNGTERAIRFLSAGVDGLYTDYLTPRWLEENKSKIK